MLVSRRKRPKRVGRRNEEAFALYQHCRALGKQVVFACRSGKRSVTASLAAQADGLPYDKHLAGGMLAWKAAGLPTKTGG